MCDKDGYMSHVRQGEQSSATRTKIAISSTVSPLRDASVLGFTKLTNNNFHLGKKQNTN